MKKIYFALLLSISQVLVFAQEKKKYSLFNPVPRNSMRAMSTDRPDITESANTVDAGHFQIETDLFKTTRNKIETGINTVENNYNLANLKLGISNKLDLQLVVGSFVNSYEQDAHHLKTNQVSGFGDLTLRAKYNFWGNDEGITALAVMPYVTFPTGLKNSYMEVGISFPFSIELGNKFSLGSQMQFDWLKSTSKSGYYGSILQTVVVSRELSKHFDAFAESYYTYNLQQKTMQASINSGIEYIVNENLKFDTGFNLGITKNTDKVYFIGLSFRY